MDRSLGRRSRSAALTNFLDFVKTLSYIVGITLGVGSIFAGVWSVSFLSAHLQTGRHLWSHSLILCLIEIPPAITLLYLFRQESDRGTATTCSTKHNKQAQDHPSQQESLPPDPDDRS